jgi:hypothetical protein
MQSVHHRIFEKHLVCYGVFSLRLEWSFSAGDVPSLSGKNVISDENVFFSFFLCFCLFSLSTIDTCARIPGNLNYFSLNCFVAILFLASYNT